MKSDETYDTVPAKLHKWDSNGFVKTQKWHKTFLKQKPKYVYNQAYDPWSIIGPCLLSIDLDKTLTYSLIQA